MATLACKVARGISLPMAGSKVLGTAMVTGTYQVPAASMHSKTSGLMEPLDKPWDYKKWGFNYWCHLWDGTTKRFKDNSKVIVVEGPPALGKTEFAKGLAEEFGMKFVPGITMDDYYVNHYGYDLRELDHAFHHIRNKSYDEKRFAQDPTGQEGGYDRMLWILYNLQYHQYIDQLAHLFNTGQGVVLERSAFTNWIYVEAAFRQGWISKTTRTHILKIRAHANHELLRPNMIIYLDAPVDVVQANIRKRAETSHPWEKDSPVFENTDYLDHMYNDLFKKQYLPTAAKSSYVLTYDWSDGGDVEVVVEDIDGMQMDYHEKYDKQQQDWRLLTEDNFASKRYMYSGEGREILAYMFRAPWFTADQIILTSDEAQEADRIKSRLPGNRYIPGYNTDIGDPEPFFNFFNGMNSREQHFYGPGYCVENMHNDIKLNHGDAMRAYFKEHGDPDWWKKGFEKHHNSRTHH